MKANAAPVLAVFEKKLRLEVPLFQRQYVWSREQQWEPLWEDISRKFAEQLEGRKDAPVHFLGAMVLDQKQTPTTHVEKRQIIDGQQRLTTIQIFLAAFRDVCRKHQCEALADECDSFTLNKGMMANPELDRFKVYPTQLDRAQFADVILSASREEVEKRHPLVRRKYARYPEPRPRMVEAYLYFHEELESFFIGSDSDRPIAAETPLASRLEEAFQALRTALQVVVIDLEQDDDAQVIFETLNARGEPLLPADLLRNYIFLRAARAGDDPESLYEKHWRGFDDPFWREEMHQGRLRRPRSDLFMQFFLASRQGIEIPIKHLFVEYKTWIEKARPFKNVADEVATLARQREHYRRIVAPARRDVLHGLATFLARFDVRTADPLLLHLCEANLSDADLKDVATTLESYLLRRAVCGMTTKNYNRVFLALTRALKAEGASVTEVVRYLQNLTGDSTGWPTDDLFRKAWLSEPAYERLQNARIVHIFERLNASFMNSKTEDITIESPLTIEHILPQEWRENWRLPDGSEGLSAADTWEAPETDAIGMASQRRDRILHTLGNLTILTQPLNSSLSNSAWSEKKPALLAASLLPINQYLQAIDAWDEAAIEARALSLFNRAAKIWPRPTMSGGDGN
jgi:hypothetical protein